MSSSSRSEPPPGDTRLGPYFLTFRHPSCDTPVTVPGYFYPFQWPPPPAAYAEPNVANTFVLSSIGPQTTLSQPIWTAPNLRAGASPCHQQHTSYHPPPTFQHAAPSPLKQSVPADASGTAATHINPPAPQPLPNTWGGGHSYTIHLSVGPNGSGTQNINMAPGNVSVTAPADNLSTNQPIVTGSTHTPVPANDHAAVTVNGSSRPTVIPDRASSRSISRDTHPSSKGGAASKIASASRATQSSGSHNRTTVASSQVEHQSSSPSGNRKRPSLPTDWISHSHSRSGSITPKEYLHDAFRKPYLELGTGMFPEESHGIRQHSRQHNPKSAREEGIRSSILRNGTGGTSSSKSIHNGTSQVLSRSPGSLRRVGTFCLPKRKSLSPTVPIGNSSKKQFIGASNSSSGRPSTWSFSKNPEPSAPSRTLQQLVTAARSLSPRHIAINGHGRRNGPNTSSGSSYSGSSKESKDNYHLPSAASERVLYPRAPLTSTPPRSSGPSRHSDNSDNLEIEGAAMNGSAAINPPFHTRDLSGHSIPSILSADSLPSIEYSPQNELAILRARSQFQQTNSFIENRSTGLSEQHDTRSVEESGAIHSSRVLPEMPIYDAEEPSRRTGSIDDFMPPGNLVELPLTVEEGIEFSIVNPVSPVREPHNRPHILELEHSFTGIVDSIPEGYINVDEISLSPYKNFFPSNRRFVQEDSIETSGSAGSLNFHDQSSPEPQADFQHYNESSSGTSLSPAPTSTEGTQNGSPTTAPGQTNAPTRRISTPIFTGRAWADWDDTSGETNVSKFARGLNGQRSQQPVSQQTQSLNEQVILPPNPPPLPTDHSVPPHLQPLPVSEYSLNVPSEASREMDASYGQSLEVLDGHEPHYNLSQPVDGCVMTSDQFECSMPTIPSLAPSSGSNGIPSSSNTSEQRQSETSLKERQPATSLDEQEKPISVPDDNLSPAQGVLRGETSCEETERSSHVETSYGATELSIQGFKASGTTEITALTSESSSSAPQPDQHSETGLSESLNSVQNSEPSSSHSQTAAIGVREYTLFHLEELSFSQQDESLPPHDEMTSALLNLSESDDSGAESQHPTSHSEGSATESSTLIPTENASDEEHSGVGRSGSFDLDEVQDNVSIVSSESSDYNVDWDRTHGPLSPGQRVPADLLLRLQLPPPPPPQPSSGRPPWTGPDPNLPEIAEDGENISFNAESTPSAPTSGTGEATNSSPRAPSSRRNSMSNHVINIDITQVVNHTSGEDIAPSPRSARPVMPPSLLNPNVHSHDVFL